MKTSLPPRSQEPEQVNIFGDVTLPTWKAGSYEKAKLGSPPGASSLGRGVLPAWASVPIGNTEDGTGFK